jgi:hypothetical protein
MAHIVMATDHETDRPQICYPQVAVFPGVGFGLRTPLQRHADLAGTKLVAIVARARERIAAFFFHTLCLDVFPRIVHSKQSPLCLTQQTIAKVANSCASLHFP